MILAIDAGHGLHTAGKRCLKSIDSKETREWILNDGIVAKVIKRLENYKDITVVRVDDPTGQVDVALKERCKRANDVKVDLYLSVHHNAGANGSSAGGITVYTYSGTKHTFQQRLYDELIKHTSLKGNRATWDCQAGFWVLKYTNMPACLMELGYMDSTTDTPIILTEEFENQCVDAIVDFLAAEYKLVLNEPTKTYRVQVGAYGKIENAKAMLAKVKASGFDAFITTK